MLPVVIADRSLANGAPPHPLKSKPQGQSRRWFWDAAAERKLRFVPLVDGREGNGLLQTARETTVLHLSEDDWKSVSSACFLQLSGEGQIFRNWASSLSSAFF